MATKQVSNSDAATKPKVFSMTSEGEDTRERACTIRIKESTPEKVMAFLKTVIAQAMKESGAVTFKGTLVGYANDKK